MLTASQKKTYDFIKKYIKKQGIAPTISEIAKGIEITSRGVVHRYVQALAAAGKIEIIPNKRRNIALKEEQTDQVFLKGEFGSGEISEKLPNSEHLNLSEMLLTGNRYALKVTGEEFVQEGICPGDCLIFETNHEVKDGESGLVIIDQTKPMLKRVYRNHDGTITLSPLYSRLLPQVYSDDQVEIKAKLVGLLRLE